MSNEKKFAVELIIDYPHTIEGRLSSILSIIDEGYSNIRYIICDIEANGRYGDELSNKMTNQKIIEVRYKEIRKLLEEDGQIIDLDLNVSNNELSLELIIVDGKDFNILSNDYSLLNEKVIGKFKYLDISLFKGGTK